MLQRMNFDISKIRPLKITRGFTCHAEGSVLIQQGNTWVLCNASVEEKAPPHLRGSGKGWVTAEYALLPRSTGTRNERESRRGKPDARASEISRLIGRSLRAAVDLDALGERSITIDCDVLQADGGTRCASITGGMIALADALAWAVKKFSLPQSPLANFVAAISVGMCNGQPVLDLDYAHDSTAEVDVNFVMTEDGRYIEVQGTAEGKPFSDAQFDDLRNLARPAIQHLIREQRRALAQ